MTAKSLASMDFHEPLSFPLYKGISSRNIKKASKPLPGRHSGTTGTKYKLNSVCNAEHIPHTAWTDYISHTGCAQKSITRTV